jgi:hypothetical protein
MATGLEIYEAFKPTVGEEAARMLAEALPMSDQIATKADLEILRVASRADLQEMKSDIFRWMLGFFATLWIGNAGLIVTLLLKH